MGTIHTTVRTAATIVAAAAACTAWAETPSASASANAAGQQALAATIGRLIEGAIPLEYDKKKDWGATTDIPVGLRTEGKGFRIRLKKQERAVNHGVWKHYTLRLVDPRQNLVVRLEPLRPQGPGRVAFTLHIDAKIDAWARAKIYQYGVHIVALEIEADINARLAIDGELGVDVKQGADAATLAVLPVVVNARLDIDEFRLRRVSNAHGPIVRELGDGVRNVVEDELNGPRLVEKLNRAIDKKRDRLTFRPAELFQTTWWPLASWSPPAAAPSQRVGASGAELISNAAP